MDSGGSFLRCFLNMQGEPLAARAYQVRSRRMTFSVTLFFQRSAERM